MWPRPCGRDTAVQLLGVDKKLLTENTSRGWRLCITTFRRNALPLHSEAVVVLAKDGIRAYRVLYVDGGPAWLESRCSSPEAEAHQLMRLDPIVPSDPTPRARRRQV